MRCALCVGEYLHKYGLQGTCRDPGCPCEDEVCLLQVFVWECRSVKEVLAGNYISLPVSLGSFLPVNVQAIMSSVKRGIRLHLEICFGAAEVEPAACCSLSGWRKG